MRTSFGRGVAFILIALAALGLGVLFPPGGIRAREAQAASPRGATPEIRECGKEGQGRNAGGDKKLELTATKGKALQFKCATNYTLGPAEGIEGDQYTKAYEITKGDACGDSPTVLKSIVSDATLTKTEKGAPSGSDQPVYTFVYKSAQSAQKRLCYKCNPPPAKIPEKQDVHKMTSDLAPGAGAQPTCTVRITVRQDEPTHPTTGAPPDSTTEAPSASTTKAPPASTSDASAIRPAVVAATGGFLAAMLLA